MTETKGRTLRSFWRSLVRNWNGIVGLIATSGYLASSFLPSNHPKKVSYQDFFLTLGVVAILMTLVEIKVLLTERQRISRFRNLREASPSIVKAVRDAVSHGHKGVLEIYILGGRIRTISDLVRGILTDIRSEYLLAADVTFSIYCMDPDFLTAWSTPSIVDADFAPRNLRYSQQIRTTIDELLAFNSSTIFKGRKVIVDIVKYRTFPTIWAFVIGNECAFFGTFTWNATRNDLEGPENACFRVEKGDQGYEDVKQYLDNRAIFYRLTSTLKYG